MEQNGSSFLKSLQNFIMATQSSSSHALTTTQMLGEAKRSNPEETEETELKKPIKAPISDTIKQLMQNLLAESKGDDQVLIHLLKDKKKIQFEYLLSAFFETGRFRVDQIDKIRQEYASEEVIELKNIDSLRQSFRDEEEKEREKLKQEAQEKSRLEELARIAEIKRLEDVENNRPASSLTKKELQQMISTTVEASIENRLAPAKHDLVLFGDHLVSRKELECLLKYRPYSIKYGQLYDFHQYQLFKESLSRY